MGLRIRNELLHRLRGKSGFTMSASGKVTIWATGAKLFTGSNGTLLKRLGAAAKDTAATRIV